MLSQAYILAGFGSLAAIVFLILLVGISRARARTAEVEAMMARHREAVAQTVIDADMKRRANLEAIQTEHEKVREQFEAEVRSGKRGHFGSDW